MQMLANERAQLFRPYNSGHTSRRRSNAREVHFRSSSIASISGGVGPEKKPKFWNANFVCLASMYAMKVPNSGEKEMLRKAGLGVRKVKLNLQDNEDEIFKKLCCGDKRTGDDEENLPVGYPQLADCGGFELTVCQPNSRQLTILDCILSTKDLRARVGGSQSKVYIRPIQKNLSLKPIVNHKTSQRTEKCFSCCKEFPVSSLRMHTLSCKLSMEFGFESSSCSEDDGIFNLDPFTTKSTGDSKLFLSKKFHNRTKNNIPYSCILCCKEGGGFFFLFFTSFCLICVPMFPSQEEYCTDYQ